MSVPVKTHWGAGGHENAGQRRAETLPQCRRATPSPAAAPRNGRRRPRQPRCALAGCLSEGAPARPGRVGGHGGGQAPPQRAQAPPWQLVGAFTGSSAAKRPPLAAEAPVCPRRRSARGRPSAPWPRGREWGRAGAAAASARHPHLAGFARKTPNPKSQNSRKRQYREFVNIRN